MRYPGLPASGCFKQTVSRDVHNMSLSTTVLAENDRTTLSKESETKTLSNLKDVYLFLMRRSILIN